ncbi:MAG: SPOR domain-containing protein [Oxalobacteraceae bacterium]|nr:SPOR domain-containing protein [Oxalobacteraceae bacterium]
MRPLFFLLLLANAIVLLLLQATQQFGSEPDRLSQQVNAERLNLVDVSAQSAASERGSANAAAKPACFEVGEFNTQTVASFEQQLAKLASKPTPERRLVQAASSQQIFIPPLPTEEAANRRLTQLRSLGFTDSAVIRDDSVRRWGISLGRFTRSELAEAHLEKLRAAGVSDARIGEYPLNATRYAIRVSMEGAESRDEVKALASKFVGLTLRACH